MPGCRWGNLADRVPIAKKMTKDIRRTRDGWISPLTAGLGGIGAIAENLEAAVTRSSRRSSGTSRKEAHSSDGATPSEHTPIEHRIADHTDVERTVHDGDISRLQNSDPRPLSNQQLPSRGRSDRRTPAYPSMKQVSFREVWDHHIGDNGDCYGDGVSSETQQDSPPGLHAIHNAGAGESQHIGSQVAAAGRRPHAGVGNHLPAAGALPPAVGTCSSAEENDIAAAYAHSPARNPLAPEESPPTTSHTHLPTANGHPPTDPHSFAGATHSHAADTLPRTEGTHSGASAAADDGVTSASVPSHMENSDRHGWSPQPPGSRAAADSSAQQARSAAGAREAAASGRGRQQDAAGWSPASHIQQHAHDHSNSGD